MENSTEKLVEYLKEELIPYMFISERYYKIPKSLEAKFLNGGDLKDFEQFGSKVITEERIWEGSSLILSRCPTDEEIERYKAYTKAGFVFNNRPDNKFCWFKKK